VSEGPPPVPGGRSEDDRERARRERAARRSRRSDEEPESTFEPATSGGGGEDDPPRAGRRAPRWGRLAALLVVVGALAAVAWFAVSLFQPFKGDGNGTPVRVSIAEGSSLGDIAQELERNGVISNAGFFELRARLAGRSDALRPGAYRLQEDMSFNAALDVLETGVDPDVTVVSLPEGLSRRELVPLVRGTEVRGSYRRASRRNPALNPRRYGAPRGASLEGFLFPATYELRKRPPARALVRAQLEAFRRNFGKVDLRYARRKNLTPYDVLIIASLIDREAAVARERKLIASVIYNRLSEDITLGIDATVRYITGNWDQPLRVSELENPSPYNTRVNPGLPPGPIGNPGLAAIRAAARPARTGYLFYVAAVCGNGKHKFAETDAEFARYEEQYRRAREERGGKSPTEC
jgi:UPF0755 protein